MSDSDIVDYLNEDGIIPGQNYVCLSFLTPDIEKKQAFMLYNFIKTTEGEGMDDFNKFNEEYKEFLINNKTRLEQEYYIEGEFKTSMHGLKIRGVFSTMEEAKFQAKKLQLSDPNFGVYIASVGKWLPWSPNADDIKDQVYANDQLNILMKEYNKAQRDKDLHFADEKRKKQLGVAE